jgi:D-erythrulose 4-kinase
VTRIYGDPARFTEDMLAGFLALHGAHVVGVPGGMVRATIQPGKVAVVVGGGSGHYPAFFGVVGEGFADGAVVGNVFTSPSAADVASVGRAAHAAAGLLLITGNYAGDVMNFTLAAGELGGEGIDARYLAVTDDLASAPPAEAARRRGIAGAFVVFKVAAAAAAAGYDLDGVQRVAIRANERTRTLGVAFSGCTLPGAGSPLFTVPAGRMGLGMGIHGEPGVAEQPLPSAAELAAELVGRVLAERPDTAGPRVAVILNGLGRTKYEELFLLWGHVAALLGAAGLEIVQPEVGELVTSLDMAGCSLTVTWLDGELERMWRAPADTPAYRKGPPGAAAPGVTRRPAVPARAAAPAARRQAATGPDRACAAVVVAAFAAMSSAITQAAAHLGELDAVAGDGDHGRGMVRGTGAALAAATAAAGDGAGAGQTLVAAGQAWADKAGGTSGVLWGAALSALGRRLGQASPVTAGDVAAGVRDAYDTVARLGHASRGDKTLLDALGPFSEALAEQAAAGQPLASAWPAAAGQARTAAQDTAALRPRTGRARPLADRSVGHPDPGAVSLAICLGAVAHMLSPAAEGTASSA